MRGVVNLALDASNELPYLMRSNLSSKKKLEVFLCFLKISIKLFTFHRLRKVKRENVLGFKINTFDYGSLHFLFREIFVKNIYFFKTDTSRPVIFDCGANIGISILYFKWLYPKARIQAFEPDPETFKLLEQNISENNLKDVVLHNIALHSKKGKVNFYVDHKNPGWLTMSTLEKRLPGKDVITVNTDLLSSYISQDVDLLKIDVEGAEEYIVQDLVKYKKLSKVSKAFFEFHSYKSVQSFIDFLSYFNNRRYSSFELVAESNSGDFQDILIKLDLSKND